MTTSSEDVLLQMSEVRYKKGDGTLYVMNERVAWMAEHRDTVAVSHRFQDIKLQKISPEGKPKVQLQVVLHDGNSSTFHFVNRNGVAAQIADRDKVKELLQQLLPNFKKKVNKELEEKNRILMEHPNLLQLYRDLVITKVLSSEEFWATHAKQYTQNQGALKQDIGVSGAFLADIKPQTDGCNGLRYNLTADIIQCIFKTYPAVKRKYQEHVPAKLSESEFWTKFFQSHYFHRDRITAGTKDIFSECGKIDDQALKVAVAEASGDPLLDIRLFGDNSLEDGFGGASMDRNVVNSGNIVHQNMIKRFNQHSIMVLKTCANATQITTSCSKSHESNNRNNLNSSSLENSATSTTNGVGTKDGNGIASRSQSPLPPVTKRARIMDKIVYEDLMGNPEDDEAANAEKMQLNLTKVERYLHGPVAASSTPGGGSDGDVPMLDLDSVQIHLFNLTDSWNARTPHKVLVSATSAVNALSELSPGGALMPGFQEQSLAQLVPPEAEKELKNLYLSLSELLRHFWTSFPPTTPELEAKVVKMHEALQRYQMAKLKPFEERAIREFSPVGASLTLHLNQLLQAADRKFAKWREIKMRR
ncbi:general transcription factor IIH subunit 1 [Lutzomyia longipalpis]|uniref:general transcription factor IIH subunit 1 n=1 Tax=Lutzomyia longipalpis TaxID=7200 RepID=UPI00248356F4|nr:general transcription factor IIH subunit 1 [Lutzomyia longipalpis]